MWKGYGLDPAVTWLKQVCLYLGPEELRTVLSDQTSITGIVTGELRKWLRAVEDARFVKVKVVPLWPFLGDEMSRFDTKWGVFQLAGEGSEVVRAEVHVEDGPDSISRGEC